VSETEHVAHTEPVAQTERVADVGEDALLSRVFPLLPAGTATLLGPGDDAAVLAAPDGRVVVSTDVLVEGRHFRRGWGTGADLGWRAAAQNLADVAAMGARPTAIVVGLVLPGDVEVDWVLDLARGLAAACSPHGVGVVGGDLAGGDAVVVAVTVHGDLQGREPVRRDGARPGDVLALAGTLGRAAAGLALLTADGGVGGRSTEGRGFDDGNEADDGAHRTAVDHAELVASYLRPTPPLELGPVAAGAGARAMIDVSDGLLRDAGRVARASGVRIDISTEALEPHTAPLAAAARALGTDPLTWVLTGGEDHGLLATFPEGAVPPGFVVVGRVLDAAGDPRVLVDGREPTGSPGYDHFGGES